MGYQYHSHTHNLKDISIQHVHHYIKVQTHDGNEYEGIVEYVDDDNMYLLIQDDERGLMEFEYPMPYDMGVYAQTGYPGQYQQTGQCPMYHQQVGQSPSMNNSGLSSSTERTRENQSNSKYSVSNYEDPRQFFPVYYPYGYPFYPYYPYYPTFRRFILPLVALAALSVLPYSYYW